MNPWPCWDLLHGGALELWYCWWLPGATDAFADSLWWMIA